MGLILWIDQNTFAVGLIEKAFKNSSIPFYSIESVNDFSYLVEDLAPSLIVLDFKTYLKNPLKFVEQYKASETMQKLPFVIIDQEGDFEVELNRVGALKRPFNPFELPAYIQGILN